MPGPQVFKLSFMTASLSLRIHESSVLPSPDGLGSLTFIVIHGSYWNLNILLAHPSLKLIHKLAVCSSVVGQNRSGSLLEGCKIRIVDLHALSFKL